MRIRIFLLMALGMMAFTGCGVGDADSKMVSVSSGETEKTSDMEAGTASDFAYEETGLWEADAETQDDLGGGYEIREPQERQYSWQEYTVTLPEEWVGRCVMEENEGGFSVYQKASYENDDRSGYICGFFRTREPVEYDHGKTIIAYTEDGMIYYLVQPGDVPCDGEDEGIIGEYVRMCQQVPQLKASLRIEGFGVHGNADEYMLSTSSILRLDPAALAGMSGYALWIARNEIYARHGRQFSNTYLQQYFNRCTWYDGQIPPQEFQDNVLNQTEWDNLQLLTAVEDEYDRRHPYPKMYQASKTAWEDLDGDGMDDQIRYQVTEQDNGEILCLITVNGESYIANELFCPGAEVGMTNPTVDRFFISDILEGDGLLEIAVLDEGPSEDPVTYFFQYNNTLTCIGQVPGDPFDGINGGVNGFNGFGGIVGQSRTDLIETAYVEDNRWYDGSRIVDLGIKWYDFLPNFGHVLYEDLPVYCEWDDTSATTVIPAQDQVFFLGTDAERWILVKGKDGSQGYMTVDGGIIGGLNKPADQVFSGLQFSD